MYRTINKDGENIQKLLTIHMTMEKAKFLEFSNVFISFCSQELGLLMNIQGF
jgi:hypothetical protein